MATTVEKICKEALILPADARIGLVERLLISLNLPTRADIDHLWAEESERRIAEIDRGETRLIPGDQVFDNIRRKYGK
ncbi:MAG TPA: addiction module protein [Deltaproteobacteria bacterium]|nr:addiction module protein [Deltaproteobacteria bacterium]HQB37935.1 addiction module protein [Deltaproteobacteria bacterium]